MTDGSVDGTRRGMGPRRISRRRLTAWGLGGAAVVAVGLVASAWVLFQRVPPWYQPAPVPAADLQAVKDDLARFEIGLSERMNGDRPFSFAIAQEQLNRWLAARERMWPPARAWIPPMMDDPFVVFEPGRVLLAGTVTVGGVRTVLNARAEIRIDNAQLFLRVFGVKGGSLPVPDALVREHLRELDARHRRTTAGPAMLPSAEDVIVGWRIPAEFVWPNGKRRFRVRDVRIERGTMTFELQPLPRPQPARG